MHRYHCPAPWKSLGGLLANHFWGYLSHVPSLWHIYNCLVPSFYPHGPRNDDCFPDFLQPLTLAPRREHPLCCEHPIPIQDRFSRQSNLSYVRFWFKNLVSHSAELINQWWKIVLEEIINLAVCMQKAFLSNVISLYCISLSHWVNPAWNSLSGYFCIYFIHLLHLYIYGLHQKGGFVNIFTTVWRFRATYSNLCSEIFFVFEFWTIFTEKKKFCFNMNQKLITKFQNWIFFFQNIIPKRYLAICLNKICTNFVAKNAKMFKLKEILKFFFPFAQISMVAPSMGIWLKLANAGRIEKLISSFFWCWRFLQ